MLIVSLDVRERAKDTDCEDNTDTALDMASKELRQQLIMDCTVLLDQQWIVA